MTLRPWGCQPSRCKSLAAASRYRATGMRLTPANAPESRI